MHIQHKKRGHSHPGDCTCKSMIINQNFLYVIKLFPDIIFQIENGGKICKPNKTGSMPIHAAAFSGAKTCMEILLKKGKYIVPKPSVRFIIYSSVTSFLLQFSKNRANKHL